MQPQAHFSMVRRTRDLVNLNPSCQGLLPRDTLALPATVSVGLKLPVYSLCCLSQVGASYCPLPPVRKNRRFQAGAGDSGLRGGLWPRPLRGCSLEKPLLCLRREGGAITCPTSESPGWAVGSCPGEEGLRLSFYPCTTASLRCLPRSILWVGKRRHEDHACLNEKLLKEGL